jgi:hypothetical protein
MFSITLLNVSYKIVAKALQKRIQPIMPEMIHEDQTRFLPMRYILDNVLVQHEVIDWARTSQQDLLLLKLDFQKAYDTVSLSFLFRIMHKIGIPDEYITMTKVLFEDAKVSVCLNGRNSDSFAIGRGVRQGCPLAPFLFLLVGETLHAASFRAMQAGSLQGIRLPGGVGQQLMVQYADDVNYTLLAQRENMESLTRLLHLFWLATGLQMNWGKSIGYYFDRGDPPAWLRDFECSWAAPGELAKLLGAPFGIELSTEDIDQFLIEKIELKLHYWTTLRLSLAARAVVVNMVLLSTLWYFITLWGGSLKATRIIKSNLMNFLWSGSTHRTRVRVNWSDCCAPKTQGGLGLIGPNEAMDALMAKWILKALQPGTSNLQIFLRYRIQNLKPDKRGTWPQSIH